MQLYTIKQVTKQTGMSPNTVRKYIKSGLLHGIKIGRKWKIDQDDLALFVARRRT
jgi:excisionase family DNA binding protein